MQEYEDDEDRPVKKTNSLPFWGNEKTMNLNPLILTNIQSSQYFKVNLYQLKTYHEVIDEMYYQVSHLEPWERGSRKTSGQTGMCGGVRGVGAGGIVSTAFCILYKLYTLRLTRKQVQGLINHSDSPYIRGLGFMYVRYTQPPADLWNWMDPYLDDEEDIDVRAGGGQVITIGSMVRHMLTKLEWHSTLFPRIPVPIQKDIERRLSDRAPPRPLAMGRSDKDRNEARKDYRLEENGDRHSKENESHSRMRENLSRSYDRGEVKERQIQKERDRRRSREREERGRERRRSRDRERERQIQDRKERAYERHRVVRKSRDRERERERRKHKEERGHHRDKERLSKRERRTRSRSRSRESGHKHRHH